MAHADVLVIGAGVVGASVAWHCARRGLTVTVLDMGTAPGRGSTSRATGGYRAQFATEINVRLSLLSRAKLQRFPEEVGADPELREVGYLFLCDSPSQLAELRTARAMQRDCGLYEATEVTVDEAARINPHVRLDGILGAAWCPTDSTLRPMKILQGYLDDAVRRGVTVHWDTTVRSIERAADGRVVRVHTSRGDFSAAHVVNAAGPWARPVAAMAGIDLPVVPTRRQIAVALGHGLPDHFPMTIWVRDAFHLRVRDGQALLNWPVDSPLPDPYDLSVQRPWVEATWAFARERVPAMAQARLDDTAHWAGLYEMSPDKTILLGIVPTVPNLVLANGSSGHGVMHSPIVGQLVSELIADGRASALDIHPLRPTRFAEGEPLPPSGLL